MPLAAAQTPSDEIAAPQRRGSADVPAYAEYDKKVRASEQLSPLDGELFGESVSLYSGATQFSHVNIDIPGNSALPVQLRRRFVVTPLARDQAYDGNGGPNNPYGGLGNWDIEVPMISGTFDQTYGWDFSPDLATRRPRCSQYFTPRTSVPGVDATAVWSGNKVHIPGQGEKELLRLDPTYPPLHYPSDGRAPTWTTSAFDAFSCLPSVSGNAGEGFAMTTPDGVSYRFDVYRERFYAPVKVGSATNRRKVVFLLASVVSDRYGNTVSYTYDGYGHPIRIASSDGRAITLTYDPSSPALLRSALVQVEIPGQPTQTRTWRYDYEDSVGGWRLIRVSLPDSVSHWTFEYNPQRDADDYLYVDYVDPDPPGQCIRPNFNAPGFTLDIGHPSGSTGRFAFAMSRQERTVPQPNCPAGTFLRTAYIDTYRLTTKTLDDTATTSSRWQYRYAQGECPRCTNTVVVQPDDSTVTHRFSNVVDAVRATPAGSAIEGQLLETIVRSPAGEELRRTVNTYVTGPDVVNAPLAGYPFPSRYGTGGGDDPSSTAIRPLRSVETTQQGVTFTRTHDTFDAFARARKITRTSSLGTKVETTTYADDKSRWILGLVNTVTNDALPTNPTVDNRYDAFGNLIEVKVFGRIDRTMAWNADGTLASVTEGPDTTALGPFKRGIPQSVTYADGTRRSATIDDAGDIRSITDENGYTTRYGYDALRRLTSIEHPNDDVAWHPTTIAYTFVDGHWRQTTTTGTARKTIDYDRRLRPVLSGDVDTASPATQRYVRRGYDYAGRETFVSYASTNANEANGTTTSYDALGRLTATSQASELGFAITTSTIYQPGFLRQFTDGRGHVTTTRFLAYDEPDESLPVAIEATADTSNSLVTTIGRDAFGKPTS
ncbi:MAG TPA: RHS repeat domain-containing protein, partial [Tahibacter sp.]|nr:RHS repeat domain-containing protein [Tahibacter sp.]